MGIQIHTKLNLWWTWIQIAVRNAAKSKVSRYDDVQVNSFESEESARLTLEFQHSMTAIVAVSFAMEALKKELKSAGYELDKSSLTKPDNCTAGFFVAHYIIQAFGLQGDLAELLPRQMNKLFRLRNESVHFESEVHKGSYPHPSGTKTAYENTIYTAEESLKAIQLAVDVLRACASSVASGKCDKSTKSVAREIKGILTMCLEIIDAEELEEIE